MQQYDDDSYTAPQADSPQGVFGFKHASSNDIPGMLERSRDRPQLLITVRR